MKIVHFSDTHLGFNDLYVVNKEGINQREVDFYKAFSDIIDNIISIKPDFVIHTGDLFHRSSPSNRAISFALKELKRLEDVKIPFIVIAGNHSTPRTFGTSSILEIIDTLKNSYAVYDQQYKKISFDEIIFHALPHINDEKKILTELEKIETSIDLKKKNVLLMHCSVGAYYLMHEFGEWVYPKQKEYIFEKMDYVALGHWHGFGSVGKYKNVFYAGSSERTSSKDKREDKGFVVVELNKSINVEHHRIKLRKSLSFEIDATNFDEELNKLALRDTKNAMVEIKLYNLTPSMSIDISNKTIMDCLPKAMSVKIKREFRNSEDIDTIQNPQSFSLESYFLSHIKENIKDENELDRLMNKAKELFGVMEAENGFD